MPGGRVRFTTTHWSVVVAAADTQRPDANDALALLCEHYWYPLYAFVRHSGRSADEAQDLTQEFFARLIEKRYLHAARPERGRFRAFLLASLKHFLAKEWHRAKAQKRGGAKRLLPLEEAGEVRYRREPSDLETPERLFERRWALTVIGRAFDSLERKIEGTPSAQLLPRIRPLLAGDATGDSYCAIAAEMGMTEGALKVAVHRLRRRFAQHVRKEIAHTVADTADIDEEIRFLRSALGRSHGAT